MGCTSSKGSNSLDVGRQVAVGNKTGTLRVAGCRLTAFPSDSQPSTLRVIDVSRNELSELPPDLPLCRRLDASHNRLVQVATLQTPRLEFLDLSVNVVLTTFFPHVPPKLRELHVSRTALSVEVVESAIEGAPVLEVLDVCDLGWVRLPTNLSSLRRLREIAASGNRITGLGGQAWASVSETLVRMDLTRNCVVASTESLPEEFWVESSIHTLLLADQAIPVTQKSLVRLPGIDNFITRRKSRLDKLPHADRLQSLCGV